MTTIKWEPAVAIPRAVVAVLLDPPAGDVVLHWGDGTSRPLTDDVAALHAYPEPNVYTATAKLGDAVIATAVIPVKDGLVPDVRHHHDPEWNKHTHWWIDVQAPDLPGDVVGPIRVDWPAGAWYPDDMLVEIADARHGHRFQRSVKPGTWNVKVTDLATRRARLDEIVVLETIYDPDYAMAYLTPEEDPAGMTVEFELTRVDTGRTVQFYFDTGPFPDKPDEWASVIVEKPEVGSKVRWTYQDWDAEQGYGPARVRYLTGDIGHGQDTWIDVPRPTPRA